MAQSWKIKLLWWLKSNCHKIGSHSFVNNLFFSCQGKTAVYDGNLHWSQKRVQTCRHMINLTPMGRARNFYAWKNSSVGGKKKRGELLCVRCMFSDGDFKHNNVTVGGWASSKKNKKITCPFPGLAFSLKGCTTLSFRWGVFDSEVLWRFPVHDESWYLASINHG